MDKEEVGLKQEEKSTCKPYSLKIEIGEDSQEQ